MSSYLAGACWVPTTWSLWQKPQCQSQASCLPLPCLSLLTTTSLFSTSVILFSFVQQCKSTMHAKSLQSCLTLCDPMDSSSPWDSPGKNTGSPPGDLPHPGIESASLMSSVLAGGFFTTGAIWETSILWLLPYLFGTVPQSYLRGCISGLMPPFCPPNKT